MSRPPRSPQATLELRDSILNASRSILVNEGYAALSMRRLAREIEYSATAIYLYFDNREAIVAELGRRGLEDLEMYVQPALALATPSDILRELARQYVRFSTEHPESYRVIFMQDSTLADAMFRSQPGKDASGAGERVFGMIQTQFQHLVKGKKSSQHAAEVFWTSLHGIVSLKITCGKFLQTPTQLLADLAVESLLAGCGGK